MLLLERHTALVLPSGIILIQSEYSSQTLRMESKSLQLADSQYDPVWEQYNFGENASVLQNDGLLILLQKLIEDFNTQWFPPLSALSYSSLWIK
jgi:hypothetical protein